MALQEWGQSANILTLWLGHIMLYAILNHPLLMRTKNNKGNCTYSFITRVILLSINWAMCVSDLISQQERGVGGILSVK